MSGSAPAHHQMPRLAVELYFSLRCHPPSPEHQAAWVRGGQTSRAAPAPGHGQRKNPSANLGLTTLSSPGRPAHHCLCALSSELGTDSLHNTVLKISPRRAELAWVWAGYWIWASSQLSKLTSENRIIRHHSLQRLVLVKCRTVNNSNNIISTCWPVVDIRPPGTCGGDMWMVSTHCHCYKPQQRVRRMQQIFAKIVRAGEKDMQCLSTDCAFENCLHVLSASIGTSWLYLFYVYKLLNSKNARNYSCPPE